MCLFVSQGPTCPLPCFVILPSHRGDGLFQGCAISFPVWAYSEELMAYLWLRTGQCSYTFTIPCPSKTPR